MCCQISGMLYLYHKDYPVWFVASVDIVGDEYVENSDVNPMIFAI